MGQTYPSEEIGIEVKAANREGREVVLSPEQMAALGHHKQPLLRVMRAFCIRCMGGQLAEVRRCTAVSCELYPYRMAKDPYRRPSGRPFAPAADSAEFSEQGGEEEDEDGSE